MVELRLWRWQVYASLIATICVCLWSLPAAAQRHREWAISVSPQLGYLWADTRFEGTLVEPGQFTTVDGKGDIRGATWGFTAACTHRFWSKDNQTALGPILAFTYGRADDAAGRLKVSGSIEQEAAQRVNGQLDTLLQRYVLQGGLGLTMLEGLLEGRLLLGGEAVDTRVPEFERASDTSVALSATLGARLRLPVTERWVGLLGANCGYSRIPSVPGGLKACSMELGLEWVIRR